MVTNKEIIEVTIRNGRFTTADMKEMVKIDYANFYTISVKLNGFSVHSEYYTRICNNRTEELKFFNQMALLMFGIRPSYIRFSDHYVHFDYYNEESAKYD